MHIEKLIYFLKKNKYKKEYNYLKKIAAEYFTEWFDYFENNQGRTYIPYMIDQEKAEEEIRERHFYFFNLIKNYYNIKDEDINLKNKEFTVNNKVKKITGKICIGIIINSLKNNLEFKNIKEELFLNGKDNFVKRIKNILLSKDFDKLIFNIGEEEIDSNDDFVKNNIYNIILSATENNIESSKLFLNDHSLSLNSNKLVVISQDKDDIKNMSTGRRWDSCTAIGGLHGESAFCESEEGGMIAYLIEKDDLQIRNPLSRLLIRRFEDQKGNSIVIPEKTTYGISDKTFEKIVYNWIEEKQGNIEYGRFYRKGGEQSDTFPSKENYIFASFYTNEEEKKFVKETLEDKNFYKLYNYIKNSNFKKLLERNNIPFKDLLIDENVPSDIKKLIINNSIKNPIIAKDLANIGIEQINLSKDTVNNNVTVDLLTNIIDKFKNVKDNNIYKDIYQKSKNKLTDIFIEFAKKISIYNKDIEYVINLYKEKEFINNFNDIENIYYTLLNINDKNFMDYMYMMSSIYTITLDFSKKEDNLFKYMNLKNLNNEIKEMFDFPILVKKFKKLILPKFKRSGDYYDSDRAIEKVNLILKITKSIEVGIFSFIKKILSKIIEATNNDNNLKNIIKDYDLLKTDFFKKNVNLFSLDKTVHKEIINNNRATINKFIKKYKNSIDFIDKEISKLEEKLKKIRKIKTSFNLETILAFKDIQFKETFEKEIDANKENETIYSNLLEQISQALKNYSTETKEFNYAIEKINSIKDGMIDLKTKIIIEILKTIEREKDTRVKTRTLLFKYSALLDPE